MRFLRSLLYGLIMGVVGLISALTAMRFAIHGREVNVPKLAGLTATEAQRVAADSGLAIARAYAPASAFASPRAWARKRSKSPTWRGNPYARPS